MTTVAGTFVAGKCCVSSCLSVAIGQTSVTLGPIAGVALAAEMAVTSILLR